MRLKLLLLALGIACSPLLSIGAFGQTRANQPGEAYPLDTRPPPKARPTPQEKAEGRSERRAEGRAAALAPLPAEGPDGTAARPRVSRAERDAARARRKAVAAQQNKAGEITSTGESGSLGVKAR